MAQVRILIAVSEGGYSMESLAKVEDTRHVPDVPKAPSSPHDFAILRDTVEQRLGIALDDVRQQLKIAERRAAS